MIAFSHLGYLGGLGNQMFQIASSIGIAKNNNTNYGFPIWKYNKFFLKKLPVASHYPTEIYKEYNEGFLGYENIPHKVSLNLYGYFQSYKYFEQHYGEVLGYFEFQPAIISELTKRYKDLDKSASIHVRRGDYCKLHNIHYNQNMIYYNEAIDIMVSNDIKTFYIFTDDKEYCKNSFIRTDVKFIFVDSQHEIIDLCLMSLCKHNIITNSSFSWWGAYLNKHKDKIVIAPSQWFSKNIEFDIKNRIPDNWIVLQSDKVNKVAVLLKDEGQNLQIQINSVNKYFFYNQDIDIVLFSDRKRNYNGIDIEFYANENEGIYHLINKYRDALKSYDYIYHLGKYLIVEDYISDDILPDESDIVVSQHYDERYSKLRYCSDKKSTAYVAKSHQRQYCNGDFFGGTCDAIFALASKVQELIDEENIDRFGLDVYLNKYLCNVPHRIISNSYNHPSDNELHIGWNSKISTRKDKFSIINSNLKYAIISIATKKYKDFLPGLVKSCEDYFVKSCDKKYFFFTDEEMKLFKTVNSRWVQIEHQEWPYVTLNRFKYISEALDELKEFDYVIYIDVDMEFVKPVDSFDIGDKKYFGVVHPYCHHDNNFYSVEKNCLSTAFIEKKNVDFYAQGCFWGATGYNISNIVNTLKDNIETDMSNGIVACWHDESHLNKFISVNNDDFLIFNSVFCYPETWNLPIEKIIIHKDKNMKEYPRFEGVLNAL